jgi:hypothetical protein
MGRIKSVFFEFLSFNSERAKVINLSSILFLLAVIPTRMIENGHSICIFKNFIFPAIFGENCSFLGGCDCPACGMTRSFSNILHGNLKRAWSFNKLAFITLTVMIILIIINVIKLIKKNKLTKEF